MFDTLRIWFGYPPPSCFVPGTLSFVDNYLEPLTVILLLVGTGTGDILVCTSMGTTGKEL